MAFSTDYMKPLRRLQRTSGARDEHGPTRRSSTKPDYDMATNTYTKIPTIAALFWAGGGPKEATIDTDANPAHTSHLSHNRPGRRLQTHQTRSREQAEVKLCLPPQRDGGRVHEGGANSARQRTAGHTWRSRVPDFERSRTTPPSQTTRRHSRRCTQTANAHTTRARAASARARRARASTRGYCPECAHNKEASAETGPSPHRHFAHFTCHITQQQERALW